MSKPVTFILKDELLNMTIGTVVFNGKFVFELADNIPTNYWKQVGFIPLANNSKTAESDELFYYLNSRLPINLREKPAKEKLDYIKESGLKVASDSFALIPAK